MQRLRAGAVEDEHATTRRGSSCRPITNGSRALAIAELVVDALESLDLAFPKPSKANLEALAEADAGSARATSFDRSEDVRGAHRRTGFSSRLVVRSASVILSSTPRAGTSTFAIQSSAFSMTRRWFTSPQLVWV